ncbi:MAG: GNAT family N-acetyltransferase [Verrucomicrobiota bacterium]
MRSDAELTCESDEGTERLLTVSDNRGNAYQLPLFENATGWSTKVLAGDTRVGQVHCLKQGEDLFLADLHVLEAATHPIQGLAMVKAWLGFDTHGRIENYRNRGLGSALLSFVINWARARGFRRVTGRLAPIDLKENPDLPDWYRCRGFRVTMAANRLEGELEMVLQQAK